MDGVVIMPPWAFAPTGDSITATATSLRVDDDLLFNGRREFNGYASKVFDLEKPEQRHLKLSLPKRS